MAGPLLYKPAPKWQSWLAIGAAVGIHFVAVTIAGIHTKPELVEDVSK